MLLAGELCTHTETDTHGVRVGRDANTKLGGRQAVRAGWEPCESRGMGRAMGACALRLRDGTKTNGTGVGCFA